LAFKHKLICVSLTSLVMYY